MKLLICLFFISCSTFATEKYVLEGTIGKSPIYLFFEDVSSTGDNELGEVRYFYKSSLKDILLEGKKEKNNFTFFIENDNVFKEKFELKKSPNGSFHGIWTSEKGAKLTVLLNPFNAGEFQKTLKEVKLIELLKEDPYNFIRANFIQFKKEPNTIFKGKTIEWYSEKHCDAIFFRLGDGFLDSEKNKINPFLNTLHFNAALAQLTCANRFDYNDGKGIESTVTLNYLDANVLGFTVFDSWYCGGAHPDFGSNGYLLDLHNAKSYELDEIIAFDKSATTEKQSGFNKYSDYRSNFFAPHLFELINKTENFTQPDNESDGCDYTDLEVWNFVSWSFTEKGIEFTPSFYRAHRNCDEPFLVSFAAIKKYKNNKFPYLFK